MLGPVRFQTEQDPRATLRIPRPIDVFPLQTTVGTVFTARADADFQITHLVASNVTGGAIAVTVYLVPASGTAGASNTVVFQKSVAANDFLVLADADKTWLMQPGMTLQALCATNDAVNLWGHGYDYQGIYG